MVAGQPLHYYYYFNPPSAYYPPYFPHQFDTYYYKNSAMEMTDDMMMPSSPNSTQSDSDNSISSVEVSPKPIQVKKMLKSEEKSEVQCCWRSCGLYFSTLDQLATHVSKVHAAGGPGGLYYCGWEGCPRNNKGFNARYKMLVHVRTHTNEKPHQCYQCKKSFSRAENLKIHSRSHSGEKPYVCPVPGCNKAYSNSSDRFKHTRTHQVEKPYPCKVPGCPKRYTDPSSLRKHVKTYKHFPNEMNAAVTVERKTESDSKLNVEMENCKINAEPTREQCTDTSCKHVCPAEKSTDILRLGAIINFRKEEPTIGWNRFLDPFLAEQKPLYPYDLSKSSNMEIDVPLDLSIHRKSI